MSDEHSWPVATGRAAGAALGRALRAVPGVLAGLALLALAANPAGAAAPAEAEPELRADGLRGGGTEEEAAKMGRYSALVRMIQLRLAERGLYSGPVGGLMSPETRAAIMAYQRLVDIEPDGLPTLALLARLNANAGAAQQLLDQLDAARQAQIEEARANLVREFGPDWATSLTEHSTPLEATDAEACFAAPEPDCLIRLALQSAARIEKQGLRDWALSHVVEAQVRAGQRGAALNTARAIADPRSVIAAVGAIAVALARSGETGEATSAAERVPDATLRDKALRAVADGQVKGGNPAAAAATAIRIKAPGDRVAALIAAARGHVAHGEREAARGLRDQARQALGEIKAGGIRDFATGELAVLEAELGEVEAGKQGARSIANRTEQSRTLAAIAVVEARAGDRRDGWMTLHNAEAALTCSVERPECQHAHARLAIAGAELGGYEAAMQTVRTLRGGYTQSFAHREVAIAAARAGDVAEAVRIATSIPEPQLRLEAMLGIAEVQVDEGDLAGALATKTRAAKIAELLENPVERAFALIDLALLGARSGGAETVDANLREATAIARSVEDPFGRARSLSRIATALAVLRGG